MERCSSRASEIELFIRASRDTGSSQRPANSNAKSAAEDLAELASVVTGLRAAVHADPTRRKYARSFTVFARWCAERRLVALPADPRTAELYLADLVVAGRSASTIEGAHAAIAWTHRNEGHGWPKYDERLAALLKGTRRSVGRPPAKKSPLTDQDLHRVLEGLGDNLSAIRDRALLTLGWFGAFRRSELVALDVSDVTLATEGLVVLVRRSKGDQEGRGHEKGIPFARTSALCPVRALSAWLKAGEVSSGPVFRRIDRHGYVGERALTDGSVARIVKCVAEGAGLDPEVFAGHSLRSGFITTAAARGRGLDAIMRQSLHRSERVARGYIRHATLFVDNAADGLA